VVRVAWVMLEQVNSDLLNLEIDNSTHLDSFVSQHW
jgi:hypothetical protein